MGRQRSPEGDRLTMPVPGRAREERRRGERVRVPPLEVRWTTPSRWAMLYKGLWRRTEHTNIQEARCVVGLLRHGARTRSLWDKRFLIMVDSLVALGALAKGRSSSRPLLRLCRQAAAVVLTYGMMPLYRYIASEVNPADGPSRGLGVGAAPETKEAHKDRAVKAVAPSVMERLRMLGQACGRYAG